MKKTLAITSSVLLFCASTFAYAQFSGPPATAAPYAGGYNGPSAPASTVAQAKTLNDDAYVTLRGKIVQQQGKEKYLFRDATGDIVIDLDDDDWRGVVVGPDDLVEIVGELDKGWNKIEVDVDYISRVQ